MTDLSSRIYAHLLAFYPEDLRRDHGPEMAFVFAAGLAAARREAGIRGALRVWCQTADEFLRFAIPSWFSTSAVRVPAISLALFAGMMLSMLPLGAGQAHADFWRWRIFFLLPLFSTPFLCLASFYACRATSPTSLKELTPCSKLAL